MMHTSAMVPPFGPAGTSRAFPHRIAGTQRARNMRRLRLPGPCPLAQTPVVVCKVSGRPSFATPLIGFGAHGARPHIHPAVAVGGPYWHSVGDGLHMFLVLGQYFRIVVIMRLRILATKLYELFWPSTVAPDREATSAQAASHHPPPRARTLQVHFLLALNRHTHPSRGHPFAQPPLGSPQSIMVDGLDV